MRSTKNFGRSTKNKRPAPYRGDGIIAISLIIIAATAIIGHLAQATVTVPTVPAPVQQNHLTPSPDKLRIIEVRADETYTQADARDLREARNTTTRTVTAYTSRVEETDSTPCISADGSDICARHARGEKICASNAYPMHTTLAVEGFGTCTVRDRMASKYSDRVDAYFGNDLQAARNFGSKPRKITLIK